MQVNSFNKKHALRKLNGIGKYMPVGDALNFFNGLLEAYREEQSLRRDLAKIQATRDVVLTEITNRYELYHRVFDQVFDERKSAIDRHFEVIDRGIAANDKDLIIHGLQGLSTIVSSSPFANLQELSRLLESGGKIEI